MSVELSPRATEIAEHTKLLLAAGGYNGFSYADLSERVNISKASIHHHFPSKADLVLTVVAQHREQAREGLAAMQRQLDDPLAQLTAYTDYWAQCIREGTSSMCICAMLAAESPMIPQEIADEVHGYFEDLTTWIATVLKKGAAKSQFHLRDSARVEAQTFMSTVHGAMLTARALGNPESFRAISRSAIGRLTA
ncbi:TetR/AcrR family transcriptional regulator [Paraburkholderia sp. Ac-20336]|uniref:TetR/AcrR family transcriptional regulator n=1 Tax=Burkholderiaceae TaxID=119060 RepID=UPI00142081F8|nr:MULTISPECIES: TetR/AcrR family transcriptional regulator [Burkholderiaceae]MBN3802127.1 TetR/AcrR family transcriptional regulator [Paraburkholderia sp. Ac-20336]MBN3851431.1 TetR/AcrR family transcriptional regulator [Paraburkholderia sp. Ac-20342]NIF54936.1 TetR/AcrR family transcriptional regulator [Burkholderia sp. Ax-1724]NIF76101.1 TetR/AcrR family transcriptional regulator [Paraburkholderia sp. Cy-641]